MRPEPEPRVSRYLIVASRERQGLDREELSVETVFIDLTVKYIPVTDAAAKDIPDATVIYETVLRCKGCRYYTCYIIKCTITNLGVSVKLGTTKDRLIQNRFETKRANTYF